MDGISYEKEIIKIIAEVSGFEEAEIAPDTNLAKDLEIDSIKAIEIIVAIEKKLKVSIRDEDTKNIETVRHIFDLINTLINAPVSN
jgi:acyl carrier protein